MVSMMLPGRLHQMKQKLILVSMVLSGRLHQMKQMLILQSKTVLFLLRSFCRINWPPNYVMEMQMKL